MVENSETKSDEALPRRKFFQEALAIVVGGVAGLIPAAAGLLVFLDPLRRKTESVGTIRVTSLTARPLGLGPLDIN